MRRIAWATLVLSACAAPALPPPVVAAGPPPESKIPLERVCQEVLPLREHTVGALVGLVRRMSLQFSLDVRPCKAGTSWPIAYATGELEPRAPMGFEVLKMEGDALLTFDDRNRDAPTINLCADLAMRIDDAHRVRAIGLWDSTDDNAFDPKHPEASRAPLAFVEIFSRSPSACALLEK